MLSEAWRGRVCCLFVCVQERNERMLRGLRAICTKLPHRRVTLSLCVMRSGRQAVHAYNKHQSRTTISIELFDLGLSLVCKPLLLAFWAVVFLRGMLNAVRVRFIRLQPNLCRFPEFLRVLLKRATRKPAEPRNCRRNEWKH